jgi:hypothetical protein
MRKIISLLFVVLSFQIFGATSGAETKDFDYQENFSQFVGFFSEAKDVGENEE